MLESRAKAASFWSCWPSSSAAIIQFWLLSGASQVASRAKLAATGVRSCACMSSDSLTISSATPASALAIPPGNGRRASTRARAATRAASSPCEQRQRAVAVATGGEGGGGGDAQPLRARAVRPDRLEETRGRVRAPGHDQQQRAMLGGIGGSGAIAFARRQEGERIALARTEGEPGAQHRHREGEQLLALDRVDLVAGRAPVAVAERFGDQQEARVGQQGVMTFQHVRGAQRQRPVAGGDGMVHRLGGDHLIVGDRWRARRQRRRWPARARRPKRRCGPRHRC